MYVYVYIYIYICDMYTYHIYLSLSLSLYIYICIEREICIQLLILLSYDIFNAWQTIRMIVFRIFVYDHVS